MENSLEIHNLHIILMGIAEQLFTEQSSSTVIVDDELNIIKYYGNFYNLVAEHQRWDSCRNVRNIFSPTTVEQINYGIKQVVINKKSYRIDNLFDADSDNYYHLQIVSSKLSGSSGKNIFVIIFEWLNKAANEPEYYEVNAQLEDVNNDYLKLLQEELGETRRKLKFSGMELETITAQLKSMNEELMTSNEELQVANEELQSVNEELYTLNSEFQQKIIELTSLNSDLDNFIKSTEVAAIFLDKSLRIRRYTSPFSRYINILPVDINRSFLDLKMSYDFDNLEALLYQALNEGLQSEGKLELEFGKLAMYKILPYLESNREINGLVIIINEEDEVNKIIGEINNINLEREWLHQLNYVSEWSYLPEKELFIFVDGNALGIPAQLGKMDFYQRIPTRFRDSYISKFEFCLQNGLDFNFEHQIHNYHEEIRYVISSASVQKDDAGTMVKISGFIQDDTGRIQDQKNIHYLENRFSTIFNAMPMPVMIVDKSKKIGYYNDAALTFFGYSEAEMRSFSISDLRASSEVSVAHEVFGEFLNNEIDYVSKKYQYVNKSGEVLYAYTKVIRLPAFDPEKRFLFVMLFPLENDNCTESLGCQFQVDAGADDQIKIICTKAVM